MANYNVIFGLREHQPFPPIHHYVIIDCNDFNPVYKFSLWIQNKNKNANRLNHTIACAGLYLYQNLLIIGAMAAPEVSMRDEF